jgi:uncharacterized protein
MSDIVSTIPPEEFAKFAGDQKAFLAWLKQQNL